MQMRFLLITALLTGLSWAGSADAQLTPRDPYQFKLRAYIDCVGSQFRQNASTIGNTLEAALSAQQSCQILYDETIATAANTGEPVDIIRDLLAEHKRTAPERMVREISILVDGILGGAASLQIMLDRCPVTDRQALEKTIAATLATAGKFDAKYRAQEKSRQGMYEIYKKRVSALPGSEKNSTSELKKWCEEQDLSFRSMFMP